MNNRRLTVGVAAIFVVFFIVPTLILGVVEGQIVQAVVTLAAACAGAGLLIGAVLLVCRWAER